VAVLIPRHKPRPGPPAAPRARRASCLRFASVFKSSGLRPTSRLVTHVAEEEIAMTREPAADDSSSWSAASAGHGAGEREELEAATHARCLSKCAGRRRGPELNGPIRASSSSNRIWAFLIFSRVQGGPLGPLWPIIPVQVVVRSQPSNVGLAAPLARL